jgi:SulP family sulfate permease
VTPRFRFDRHELAGGLGDAGLLVPLAVALVTINGLSATAVFAGAGLVYVLTALYFQVPIPVQPLKAFGAAAIALRLDAEVIAAGALLMSAAMGFLAVTGLARWLAERFPLVLIRGIQASVALLLCEAAVELAERGNWTGLPAIPSEVALATAAVACAALFGMRSRSVPGTLLVLGGGVAAGIAVAGGLPSAGLGPEPVAISVPDAGAFATALTTLVVAQLPLTFGNSVVATTDAERSYFGQRAARVRPARLAGSIGAANLLAGLTHGLPLCHGAGGVTAHVKLGARTAGATLSVGALYLVLALLFGASLPALLRLLVPGALAGMLLYVAIQHGLLAARLERLHERVLAAGVGLVTLLSGNLAIGFGAGAVVLGGAKLWRGASSGSRPVPEGALAGRAP